MLEQEKKVFFDFSKFQGPQQIIIDQITDLIINKLKITGLSMDSEESGYRTDSNYFMIKDKIYPLLESDMDQIYSILSQTAYSLDPDLTNKKREKENMIKIKGLKEVLNNSLELFALELAKKKLIERTEALVVLRDLLLNLEKFNRSTFITIMIKTLGEEFLYNLHQQAENYEFNFVVSFIGLSHNLGKNLFSWISELKFDFYQIILSHYFSTLRKDNYNDFLIHQKLLNKKSDNFEDLKFVMEHLSILYKEKKLCQIFFDFENIKINETTAYYLIQNQIISLLELKKKKKFNASKT